MGEPAGPSGRGCPRALFLEKGGRLRLSTGTSEAHLPGCILGIVISRSSMWPWAGGALVGKGRALMTPTPVLLPFPGPLRSMVEDLQSEESDEDDSSSGEEAAGKTNAGRDSRCLGRWGPPGMG